MEGISTILLVISAFLISSSFHKMASPQWIMVFLGLQILNAFIWATATGIIGIEIVINAL